MTIDELIEEVRSLYPDRYIEIRINFDCTYQYRIKVWNLSKSFQLVGNTPDELHSQLHSLGES